MFVEPVFFLVVYALCVEIKVGFPHCSLHPCTRMHAGYSQPVNVPGQCFQPLTVPGWVHWMQWNVDVASQQGCSNYSGQ